MDSSIYSNSDKEILEWELSLNSCNLRAHAWYHGNIPRNVAELLLEQDGEFLVRESSTFGKSGDFVLSTKWNGVVLHFLIQKEVLQPDTIYEQLGYRFEHDVFNSVPALINYYVGNREPISARSGAIISIPHPRKVPISKRNKSFPCPEKLEYADYVTLAQQVMPVEALIVERGFIPEGHFQVSLNLKPPPGLLEELEDIPDKIRELREYKESVSLISEEGRPNKSFDLATFSSILLPTKVEEITMNPALIEEINNRILEASDRGMAFHITLMDWNVLNKHIAKDEDDSVIEEELTCRLSGMYERILNESEFRWNCVIERYISFSHFVIVSVLGAYEREEMLNKWVGIARELKTGMGNFFSFCSIMRGLISPKMSSSDGPIDWLKLRRKYTNSVFEFETSLRNAYHNLVQGTDSYPPNTIVPNIFASAIILEGTAQELLPPLSTAPESDKLEITVAHMKQFYMFCENEDMYRINWERLQRDSNVSQDLILIDICRTETHLLLLWRPMQYEILDIFERSKHMDEV